jgi:hypothetical protein
MHGYITVVMTILVTIKVTIDTFEEAVVVFFLDVNDGLSAV